jgi:hypothetical protein
MITISEKFARAIQEDLKDLRENMATKDDIRKIREEMATKAELNELREDVNMIKEIMVTKTDLAIAKAEIIREIRDNDIAPLRTRVDRIEKKIGMEPAG